MPIDAKEHKAISARFGELKSKFNELKNKLAASYAEHEAVRNELLYRSRAALPEDVSIDCWVEYSEQLTPIGWEVSYSMDLPEKGRVLGSMLKWATSDYYERTRVPKPALNVTVLYKLTFLGKSSLTSGEILFPDGDRRKYVQEDLPSIGENITYALLGLLERRRQEMEELIDKALSA